MAKVKKGGRKRRKALRKTFTKTVIIHKILPDATVLRLLSILYMRKRDL